MRFLINVGDHVVTPFDDRPNLTPHKKYKVWRMRNSDFVDIIDDTGHIQEYSIHTFFEADAYYSWSLYRVFKILAKLEDEILLK